MNSNFQTEAPMFIKIVLEDTIKERRLEIPSGFVTEFGNGLRNPIILEVPNGKTWQVKMRKIGEKFWLVKGWVEFSEHYSLKKGHLLVFKYGGSSHFNVLIFDMSAMEIDYPGTSRESKSQPKILKNKEIPAPISDQQHIQDFQGNLASSSRVDTNANNFSSSNPWFEFVVKPNNLEKLYVVIPYAFIQKHMECESKIVLFKVEDKSWPVKLNVYPNWRASVFNAGVSAFLRDNSLKIGDVCIFELIDNVFNVSIFRI